MQEQIRGVGQLDPKLNPDAERRWARQIHAYAPSELLNAHSNVGRYFRGGEHDGESVDDLKRKLREGSTRLDELPALVAARYKGHLWVVFGNRRLKALQELEPEWPELCVRAIVHDLPVPADMERDLARKFELKFLLAWTTESGGTLTPFRS